MDFTEYLKSKKIDPKKFKQAETKRFLSFEELFDQVHPNSFTAQKLFLINKIRRRYRLEEEKRSEKITETVKKIPSKMIPKPKLKVN